MLNIPLKDYLRETRIFNTRLGAAGTVVAAMTLLLLARLVYVQVIEHRHYATLSQANRIKTVPVPPARGLILDRNGVVLAQNFPVYTLEIVPEQVEDMDALLAELGTLVRITPSDLKNFERQLRERPRFEGLALRAHLNEEEAARIAVRLPFLRGVELRARLQRHYPLGGLAVHALGYVSRISGRDLARIDPSAYRGIQHIGKLGLEYTYENLLVGTVGIEKVEINAHGRELRTLERQPPVPGKDLHLSLDARAQAVAEQALGERRGAVVAIDPATGGVLVFASTPTYDPNAFVNGIDAASYRALLHDPDRPLINRALRGQYAPGSTIKPFYGLADLEAGDDIDMERDVYCTGTYHLPGTSARFGDWKAHGRVRLRDAIAQSCDVYFYRLAVALGAERLRLALEPFGFGAPTGIDLPEEKAGLVPSPEWKLRARKEPWYAGDTVVAGIGQGLILATPLQLANAAATLAAHGTRMKPTLLDAWEDPLTDERTEVVRQPVRRIRLADPHNWAKITGYMADVVHSRKGTAQRIGYDAPYHIAGKTGTAQVAAIDPVEGYDEDKVPERLRDHALFIAFAPVEAPKVALAVIVENGGSGSGTAAPIARRVLDQLLLGGADVSVGARPPAPVQ